MSDKNSQLISLLNFDPKSQREPVINSPRSLEACRRQGINPHELLSKTPAEIKEIFGNKIHDKEGLDLTTQHYEERRREKVRVLIEERAQLMEDEKNGYLNFSSPKEKKNLSTSIDMSKAGIQALLNTKTDSTLIEKEKKQLQRIKERQEKEIKQLMDYEAKMAEIYRKQEEKIEQEKEKERLKEMENARKRREHEERKMIQQLEKEKKTQELEEYKKKLVLEAQKREEEKVAKEQEMERKRQMELRAREEEQRRKHEEFAKKTEELAKERQNEILRRKEEIEMKDKIRHDLLHQQALNKQREAEEKRRQLEEKLAIAKEKTDEALNRKKMEFEEKQARNDEKKRLFEYERQKKLEESKRQAELHAEIIKKVLEGNEKLQEEKKEKFNTKKTLAEERKRELDMLHEAEMAKKMEEERMKEESRKQVKENMESKLNEKVNKYLSLMEHNDMKLAKAQQAKEEEARKKYHLDILNQNDRVENVQRKAKMDEYRRHKLLEKIESDVERGERIKQDRAVLLEMRQAIKREMQASKQGLMEQFEKIKRGKLNNDSVMEEQTTMKSTTRSKYNTLSHDRSSETFSKRPNMELTQPTESTHRKISENNTKRSEAPPQQPQQQIRQKQEQAFEIGLKGLTEKEARKGLEELKMRHNQEMLRALGDEHNKENQREAKLRGITDPQERLRYEKSLALDKAKSNAKIQQIVSAHEESIRQYTAKCGVKL